jgi:pimeloyl-ACP methyl ester carboxylesterase
MRWAPELFHSLLSSRRLPWITLISVFLAIVSAGRVDPHAVLWASAPTHSRAGRSVRPLTQTNHFLRRSTSTTPSITAGPPTEWVADRPGGRILEHLWHPHPHVVAGIVILAAWATVLRCSFPRAPQPLAALTVSGLAVDFSDETPPRPWTTHTWAWRPADADREYSINYARAGTGPRVLVLVHGFGADVNNWREVIPFAGQSATVYAIDLLGYGRSEKPTDCPMSIDLWSQQLTDFCRAFIPPDVEFVLVGNSIGSLVAVTATADFMWRSPGHSFANLKGLLLFNCAIGMNNRVRNLTAARLLKLKTWDEYLFVAVSPIFYLIERLLRYRPTAEWLFRRVASEGNVGGTLRAIYTDPSRVDSDLVRDILAPAADAGALDVFVSTLTGDPGRQPKELVDDVPPGVRVAVLWGRQDKFTPVSGPVGRLFRKLAAADPEQWRFKTVTGGHVLHDDVPDVARRWMTESLRWVFDGSEGPFLLDDAATIE